MKGVGYILWILYLTKYQTDGFSISLLNSGNLLKTQPDFDEPKTYDRCMDLNQILSQANEPLLNCQNYNNPSLSLFHRMSRKYPPVNFPNPNFTPDYYDVRYAGTNDNDNSYTFVGGNLDVINAYGNEEWQYPVDNKLVLPLGRIRWKSEQPIHKHYHSENDDCNEQDPNCSQTIPRKPMSKNRQSNTNRPPAADEVDFEQPRYIYNHRYEEHPETLSDCDETSMEIADGNIQQVKYNLLPPFYSKYQAHGMLGKNNPEFTKNRFISSLYHLPFKNTEDYAHQLPTKIRQSYDDHMFVSSEDDDDWNQEDQDDFNECANSPATYYLIPIRVAVHSSYPEQSEYGMGLDIDECSLSDTYDQMYH